MKTLSDYKGEEAIELWGDLIELLAPIFSEKEVAQAVTKKGSNKLLIAKQILKTHKKEAEKILLRIDSTPIDGLNVVIRLAAIISEIGQDETIKSFFGFAEQEKTDEESTGLPMANTEAEEK